MQVRVESRDRAEAAGAECPWQSAEFWRAVEFDAAAPDPLEWAAFQRPASLSPARERAIWKRLCERIPLLP